MSRTTAPEADADFDCDVVIVGGGPAGCSAGVFTARYGLETVIFDRGNSSLRRCAYLENYLGFPAGVDVETMYGLMHDHAEEAGCEIVSDRVEAVDRTGEAGFVVETQDGKTIATDRVVAAARYDAEYLRPLDDENAMFAVREHGGEEREYFDREYPNDDGTTPIDGLYVATPAGDAEAQAIMAAGRGARVGRTVLADARRDRGFPDEAADHWDWVRREADLTGERTDRDRWRAWFDERLPDDYRLDEGRVDELRERDIDRRLDAYLDEKEVERRTERGHRRLLDHIDDDVILAAARDIEAERESSADDD